jgi:hypothetical protein
MEVKANNPILYKGTGTPYLAIFDNQGIPVMNPLTGIPLGAYISSWSYVYDEEKENLATITIDTGNPDTVDVEALQENRDIFLQWGYIFSDGTFVSSPAINIKVRDFDCIFDSTVSGLPVSIVIVAKFSFSSSYTYDQLLIYAPKGIPVRGFITGIP